MMKTEQKTLAGRTAAVIGATGDLGRALCCRILELGGSLIIMGRNPEKCTALQKALQERFPAAWILVIHVDLADMESVKSACAELAAQPLDVLVHNAGVYRVPRKICSTGYDIIFQTNFVAPYFMTRQLLPLLEQRHGKVVAVGSIAHNYSETDPEDTDFSRRKQCSLAYGNSKRYLMFALAEFMHNRPAAELAIAHPGIAVTNMTTHFPAPVYWLMKGPGKILFLSPKQAAENIVQGILTPVPFLHWIGPRYFRIWGRPSVQKLTTCSAEERQRIAGTAEKIYRKLLQTSGQ